MHYHWLLNQIHFKSCLDVMSELPDESIDLCITDCPYKIIAWGVRIVDMWDECSWILAKRDYSKTDPKLCLNRGRIVKYDDNAIWKKRIKKDWWIPNVVKDWKMFEHNDIWFNERLPELYRFM